MIKNKKIIEFLGDKADYLLNHICTTVDKKTIHLPSPNHVSEIWMNSNRNNQVLRSLQALLGHGRLRGGMGLILGRKAFQRPFNEGVDMLQAIQDVYLDKGITIA
jgi:hypothetical protein